MAIVNIEYDINSLVCGRLTIGKDNIIVIADETVYQFLGNGSLYPVEKLVYEDDREYFVKLSRNRDYKDSIIIRIKRSDGMYRWCVIFAVNRNLVVNEDIYTELEIRDIISMNNRFSSTDKNVNKYRNLLNLVNDKFFEYNFKTEIIKIYKYKDTQSEIFEKDTLDEFEKRSLRVGYVADTSIVPFHQLCENIRDGLAGFSAQFQTSLLSKGEQQQVLDFKGQTIFRGNEKILVVGLISTVNSMSIDKDYYHSAIDCKIDSGTGLMNKKSITEFATNKINTYNLGNEKGLLCFIILDIDNFKLVNDTYGHMFGDEIILKLANALKKAIGQRGGAGRIGGDEFLILLENIKTVDDIKAILKSIRKYMQWDFNEKNSTYTFTCSIGVSQYGKDALDYETLFRIADKALYIAKNKGGDRYIIYDREKHGDLDRDQSETILSKAVLPMMKTIDKSVMVSEFIRMLSEFKNKAIPSVLDELVMRMNISGICVYIGEEFNRIYSSGFYSKMISNSSYINEESYLELFDEHGINTINNVEKLAIDYTNAYKLWKNSEICSSLQILIENKNHINGMISFDIIGKIRRKWSEVDISILYMIAKILGEVIIKESE